MKPCAFATIDVSSLSCLSCPFARCLPSLVWPLGPVLSSEVHVVGLVSVEQLLVQDEAEVVVVVPPLLLLFVLPPLLLEACNAEPRRREGTRDTVIPATITAVAPTLPLVY